MRETKQTGSRAAQENPEGDTPLALNRERKNASPNRNELKTATRPSDYFCAQRIVFFHENADLVVGSDGIGFGRHRAHNRNTANRSSNKLRAQLPPAPKGHFKLTHYRRL